MPQALYEILKGFKAVPSPFVISVSAFRLITGRTPKELSTLFHGFKLPEGLTFQAFALELLGLKLPGERDHK